MEGSILTPEEIARLEKLGACPYWQKLNPTGTCVEKWWAGGPASKLFDGLAVIAGMAFLALLISEAHKVKLFEPAFQRLAEARKESSFLMNRRGRRARRRRPRRR